MYKQKLSRWKSPPNFQQESGKLSEEGQGITSILYYVSSIISESNIHGFSRFTPEEKAKRHQLCHIPFGFGPRNCIGMRLALLETKIVFIELLKRYTFVKAPDTEVRNRWSLPDPFIDAVWLQRDVNEKVVTLFKFFPISYGIRVMWEWFIRSYLPV